MKLLLKNGRILDPSQGLDTVGSVLIEDAQIAEIGPDIRINDVDEVYDCSGLWICPGLVDLHVHLREPGGEHKETILTGTQAAAAGGYTNICCMPNTEPPLDSPTLIDFILDRAASPEAGGVFVAPVGALTKGLEGKHLSDLAALKRAGIVAASDEGYPTQDALVMKQAMEFCVQLDLPIIAHCEDASLLKGGAMNEGDMSAMLGLHGIPRSAEEVAVARNCILAMHAGCQLHIMRVSTWGTIELIRQAKHLGAPVTCEVAPPHFVFTENAVGDFDTRYKMQPPLRTEVDVDIILQALQDGTIDCISSDHSPHAAHEVHAPFEEAPFGVVGIESVVGVTLTYLTHRGVLSPLETIRKLSTTPAQILRLDAGTLKPGAAPVAQVTVIDPNVEWVFDVNRTFSKSKNSPFHGSELRGKPVLTFCGVEVYRDVMFDSKRYATVM
ncbi:MAG: dihydroorotase [Fimbriimonadaceae bacterium]|nr:Dihydroorotase [Fimbriimonadaceae bacterium]MCL4283516.1 dihydroorotase [Fimbriimonadaceae bacterium]QOJ11268.1 MAG: dihydroorotase [Chthonomonadaceae bacterium]RIJ98057.1 MAG: dihydroorotase [Armatimonadota bacterium]